MKNIHTKPLALLIAIFISLGFIHSSEKSKIHLKVSKEENGEKTVFEKVYFNMDELKADEELKNFDVMIDQWTSDKDQNTIHFNHVNRDGDKKIIIVHSNDDDVNTEMVEEKIIRIKTEDGEQNLTFDFEGDGNDTMVWIDEHGNKTELTDADIEEMVQEHEEVNIEVIASDDEESEPNILIKGSDGDHTAEIEVEIEKEIGPDGDQVMVTVKKSDNQEVSKQTMDINIEEQNGEKFIEINIKRTNDLNVIISEIQEGDESLNDVDYSLKNNLKPSPLNYYPNPSNGRFNLDFKLDLKKEVTIKVLDILGNEVYKETLLDFDGIYQNEIDLTGKEKGIYILQVIQKKKTLARKILIE